MHRAVLWHAAIACACFARLVPASGAEPPRPSESDRFSKPIVVSVPTNNYPNSFLGKSGHPEGFTVELLDAVARVMGLKLQREEVESRDSLAQIMSGKYDLIPSFSFQKDREQYVDFSASYLSLAGAIFVNESVFIPQSLSELNGRKVVVVGHSSPGEKYLTERSIKADMGYATSGEQAMKMLADGKADAVFLSRLSALSIIERYQFKTIRSVDLINDGYEIRLCFAVRKGDAALLSRLNEGLAILHRTGEFDRIYQKWYGRLEPHVLTKAEVTAYIASALGVALIVTLWALIRQRQLRRRLARQATELAESRAILAEAQSFAQLGHWQRILKPAEGVMWSDETFRIFERDPREGPPEKLEMTLDYAIASDRGRWKDAITGALTHGRPYSMEITIEPKPGQKKIMQTRGRGMYDDAGELIGAFGTVQDMTAWRTTERALQQSEQHLRVLYENLPYALGVVEKPAGGDWKVVSFNPKALEFLKLPVAPPPGIALGQMGMTAPRQEFWRKLLDRVAQEGTSFRTEHAGFELARDFSITVAPLGTSAGAVRCCVFVEDITERKQKDAEISQSRRLRAIGELVGGIAHEFNNLLTPILLKSGQLQEDYAANPGLYTELKLITDATRRSAQLTQRLLAFGRKADAAPEQIDLKTVIESNLDLLRHTIDRRIRVESALPRDLPAPVLNSGTVHQIILNLLLNAKDTLNEKLTHPPSSDWIASIRIDANALAAEAVTPMTNSSHAASPSRWVRVTVSDNGLGMSPAVRERIFEPFFTTKPVGQGTGLGLATVWHLLTEIGGRIEVESAEGHGTAFHIFLPIHHSPAIPTNTSPMVTAERTSPTQKLNLLVAEDEEVISRLIKKLIEYSGHTATITSNGLEAWEKLSADPRAFDGVIFDLNMPALTGLEFAQRARALPYTGPMMVMSGRISEEEQRTLAGLRVTPVLHKPFTVETFREALDELAKLLEPAQPK